MRVRSGYEFNDLGGGEELGVEFDPEAIDLDAGAWIALEKTSHDLVVRLEEARAEKQPRLDSEEEQALDGAVDAGLVKTTEDHMKRLRGHEDTVTAAHAAIASERRAYAVASMLGFLQSQLTELALALSAYQDASEGTEHATGVPLHDLRTGWRGGFSLRVRESGEDGPSELLGVPSNSVRV